MEKHQLIDGLAFAEYHKMTPHEIFIFNKFLHTDWNVSDLAIETDENPGTLSCAIQRLKMKRLIKIKEKRDNVNIYELNPECLKFEGNTL